jgi:TrmH family RNA methyltransferase
MIITSTQNSKVKWVRQLLENSKARRESRLCVVEGVRLAEEALLAGWHARYVLYSDDLSARGLTVVNGFAQRGSPVDVIRPALMRGLSDTETPQGLLVVLEQDQVSAPAQVNFIFIPDNIRDPGNLGTMLRTCAAAGMHGVFIPPGTTDPWSPKVLRAAMGAHFHLPLGELAWEAIAQQLRAHGLVTYLASISAGIPYTQADLLCPLALIVSSEAHGAGPEAESLAQQRICIPMPGTSESLNAAVAAGILIFEVVKQRGQA